MLTVFAVVFTVVGIMACVTVLVGALAGWYIGTHRG